VRRTHGGVDWKEGATTRGQEANSSEIQRLTSVNAHLVILVILYNFYFRYNSPFATLQYAYTIHHNIYVRSLKGVSPASEFGAITVRFRDYRDGLGTRQ